MKDVLRLCYSSSWTRDFISIVFKASQRIHRFSSSYVSLYPHTCLVVCSAATILPLAATGWDAKVHAWASTHVLLRSVGELISHRKGIWLMRQEAGDKFFSFPPPDGLYGDAVGPFLRNWEISLSWNRLWPTQWYIPLCFLSFLPYFTTLLLYSYFLGIAHKLLLQVLFSKKLRYLEISHNSTKFRTMWLWTGHIPSLCIFFSNYTTLVLE